MKYKNIDRTLVKRVYSIEKKLKKDLRECNLNKGILKRINKEASILGRAKLVCTQLLFLNSRKIKEDKEILERIRKQMLYFHIELFRLNHKLHDALISELKADARLLKNRVVKKLSLQHAYEDFFYKLKALARHLRAEGEYHLRNYYSATTNKKAHLALAAKVTRDLSLIYNLLKSEDYILRFRKIILIKTTSMFKELLRLSAKNSRLIAKEIKLLGDVSRRKSDKMVYKIALIIDKQIKALHNFAMAYNNYIIHSEPFYVGRKKYILITHKVKPVF